MSLFRSRDLCNEIYYAHSYKEKETERKSSNGFVLLRLGQASVNYADSSHLL
jgi:hypothetical protein